MVELALRIIESFPARSARRALQAGVFCLDSNYYNFDTGLM